MSEHSRPCAECGLPALMDPVSTHRVGGGGPICATCANKAKPALTPDQWKRREVYSPSDNLLINAPTAGEPQRFYIDLMRSGEHARLSPTTRHALAALALHGQPFGFTHDDLRRIDGWIAFAKTMSGGQANTTSMSDLRAKIAALLPPERS